MVADNMCCLASVAVLRMASAYAIAPRKPRGIKIKIVILQLLFQHDT